MNASPREPESWTRRDACAVLARGGLEELHAAWDALPDQPEMEVVRAPETGLVMVRGRIGGGGAPFNVGEVTVSRAVVRMATGEAGFGHVLGREPERALLVARFDALWQSERHRAHVERAVLSPIRDRLDREEAGTRARAAATRVNFFTMVRGEDE